MELMSNEYRGNTDADGKEIDSITFSVEFCLINA